MLLNKKVDIYFYDSSIFFVKLLFSYRYSVFPMHYLFLANNVIICFFQCRIDLFTSFRIVINLNEITSGLSNNEMHLPSSLLFNLTSCQSWIACNITNHIVTKWLPNSCSLLRVKLLS